MTFKTFGRPFVIFTERSPLTKTTANSLDRLANQYAHLPTPLICEWDSDGKEFGVEYTNMPRLPGVSLDAVWEGLDVDARRDVMRQLAEMVIKFKLQVASAVVRLKFSGARLPPSNCVKST